MMTLRTILTIVIASILIACVILLTCRWQISAATGVVGVLGESAHEGQVDMDVRIDETGEDVLSRCVDDFSAATSFVPPPVSSHRLTN